MDTYLESVVKLFHYYKLLAEKAMDQLEEEHLFKQQGQDSNSISVIVKHMAGNMLSRWTDFLTTDGEKPWRKRDLEFTEEPNDREYIMQLWQQGWDCVLTTLASLRNTDLSTIIYIRNEGHTVIEAINRQIAHYAYHVGQIVYSAKQFKGTDWINLSIPRNISQQYNTEKFKKEKAVKNFIQEELKRLNK